MPELVSLSLNAGVSMPGRRPVKARVDLSSSQKLVFLNARGCDFIYNKGKELSGSEALLAEKSSSVYSLNLPSLKCFSYYDGERPDGRLIFSEFIQNSLPALTVLDVTGFAAHDDTLVPALKLLTALEELRIHHWDLTPRFFRMLTPDKNSGQGSNSIICPSLRKLYLLDVNQPESEIESGGGMEVEDETGNEEEMEIEVEINNDHGNTDHDGEGQHTEASEHGQASHLAFVADFCSMVEWRHVYLNTLNHIWVYNDDFDEDEGIRWRHLLTESNNYQHNGKTIEAWFDTYICVESLGDKPPHPADLRKIAASLPQ